METLNKITTYKIVKKTCFHDESGRTHVSMMEVTQGQDVDHLIEVLKSLRSKDGHNASYHLVRETSEFLLV